MDSNSRLSQQSLWWIGLFWWCYGHCSKHWWNFFKCSSLRHALHFRCQFIRCCRRCSDGLQFGLQPDTMWRIHSYENYQCCWLNMIPDSIVHWNISNLYVKAAIWKYNFKSNMNTTSSQASASFWLKRWLKTTIASNLLSIDEFTSKTCILYQNWSRKFAFWGFWDAFAAFFCQLLNR